MKDDGFNLRYDISNPTECTGILERGGTEISLGYSGLCRYHYWFTLHGWRHSMDRHLDNLIEQLHEALDSQRLFASLGSRKRSRLPVVR